MPNLQIVTDAVVLTALLCLPLSRTVTHQWRCTTPTGPCATSSCSSTTRRWPTASTRWSWTASRSRPTSSWASVTWSWRTTTRPSATCRKVRANYYEMVKLLRYCVKSLVIYCTHVFPHSYLSPHLSFYTSGILTFISAL